MSYRSQGENNLTLSATPPLPEHAAIISGGPATFHPLHHLRIVELNHICWIRDVIVLVV